MSECVSRLLVDMTSNQHYIYTHTCNLIHQAVFQACPVLRETAITFASQSSFLPAGRTLTLPSIFHLYLQPPSSAFILPLMIFPVPSLYRSALSHISSTLLLFAPSPPPFSFSLLCFSLQPLSDSQQLPSPSPHQLFYPPKHCAPAHCLSLAPLLNYHLCVSGWPRWTLYLVNIDWREEVNERMRDRGDLAAKVELGS